MPCKGPHGGTVEGSECQNHLQCVFDEVVSCAAEYVKELVIPATFTEKAMSLGIIIPFYTALTTPTLPVTKISLYLLGSRSVIPVC